MNLQPKQQPTNLQELINMSTRTVTVTPTQYTLNIGLVASAKFDLLAQSRVMDSDTAVSGSVAQHAKDILAYHVANNIVLKFERELNLPPLSSWKIAQSDTEPTLVLAFDLADCIHSISAMKGKIKGLADYYAQDCIALRQDSSGVGYLLGRYVSEWGEFNPDYFLDI